MITVPARIRAKAVLTAEGQAWLAALPDLCRRCCDAWSLRLGAPFTASQVSLVVAADRAGEPVALKVPLPLEIELGTLAGGARSAEAAALRVWAGDGAVRLIEHDHETGAMLVERWVPGGSLDQLDDAEAADAVAVALLARLHSARSPTFAFDRLADRARRLAEELPDRVDRLAAPFDRRLLVAALSDLAELSAPVGPEVLLHGDLHHDNILSAGRLPWLAIDPLPLVGDPAYDAVQYLLFRKGDLTDPETEWNQVIMRFCALLGVDSERVKAWLFARLVSDALAASEEGATGPELEAVQGDLWTARLVRQLRS